MLPKYGLSASNLMPFDEARLTIHEIAKNLTALNTPGDAVAASVNTALAEFQFPPPADAAVRGYMRLELGYLLADRPEAERKLAETIVAYNLFPIEGPEELAAMADLTFDNLQLRLAVAGYSSSALSEASGYETGVLDRLAASLKRENGSPGLGLLSSPTCDPSSIHNQAAGAASRHGLPIVFVTAEQYLGYITPDPPGIDTDWFVEQPKFFCPSGPVYSRASAEASNALLVRGGGDVSGQDFKNHVELGHPVVLEVDGRGPCLNPAPNRLRSDNASVWIAGKLEKLAKGESLLGEHDYEYIISKGNAVLSGIDPKAEGAAKRLEERLSLAEIPVEVFVDAKMMEKTGLTPEWFEAHRSTLSSNTTVVTAGDVEGIAGALQSA